MMNNRDIKPCTNCGMDWSEDTIDTLYPQNREKTSYVFGCMTHNSGCGRQVYAKTAEKAILRWNEGYTDEWII